MIKKFIKCILDNPFMDSLDVFEQIESYLFTFIGILGLNIILVDLFICIVVNNVSIDDFIRQLTIGFIFIGFKCIWYYVEFDKFGKD
jgi:hypothetical protein